MFMPVLITNSPGSNEFAYGTPITETQLISRSWAFSGSVNNLALFRTGS